MIHLIIILISRTQATLPKCNRILNRDALYNLEPLRGLDFRYRFNNDSDLVFSFCNYTTQKCFSRDNQYTDAYAILAPSIGQCTRLTDNGTQFTDSFELLDSNNPQKGIQLSFFGGENNSSVKYKITCDLDQIELKILKVTLLNSQYTIDILSQYGCPVLEISQLWQILQENYMIVAIFTVSVGLLENFYGKRLLQPTLFIIGYLLGFMTSIVLFSEILSPSSHAFYIWVALMISVLVGASAGWVSMNLPRIGFTLIGIGLGVVIVLLSWNALIHYIYDSNYFLYFLMVLSGAICAYLSWRIFDHVIIFSTSILGVIYIYIESYLVIRSISWFFGGFPNEITLSKQLYYGQEHVIGVGLYIYLVMIIMSSVVGICFQYKEFNKPQTTISEVMQEQKKQIALYTNGPPDQYTELQNLQDVMIESKDQLIKQIDDKQK